MNQVAERQPVTSRWTRTPSLSHRLARLPWWLLVAALLALLFVWVIRTNENYSVIFGRVVLGIRITVFVTMVAYALALLLGLLVGLARTSTNILIYQISTFYVEIVRGVPMLVLLFYIAFVAGPQIVNLFNAIGRAMLDVGIPTGIGGDLAAMTARDFGFLPRAILALMIGYSAFLSEIFRAGIQSIGKGQTEAAKSLGMTYWQRMRYVILPQAIKNVMPPLGNDFVAMLKDSSLVSVVGVRDITRLGDTYATSTFRFFEAFNVVAFLYLVMTIVLSLLVRYMERRLSTDNS